MWIQVNKFKETSSSAVHAPKAYKIQMSTILPKWVGICNICLSNTLSILNAVLHFSRWVKHTFHLWMSVSWYCHRFPFFLPSIQTTQLITSWNAIHHSMCAQEPLCGIIFFTIWFWSSVLLTSSCHHKSEDAFTTQCSELGRQYGTYDGQEWECWK